LCKVERKKFASERDSFSSQRQGEGEQNNGVYVKRESAVHFDGMKWASSRVEVERGREKMEKERREGRRTGTFRGEREMMNSLLNCNISLG